nr:MULTISPECIES: glycosyltransferase family 4 protein [unclassified Pannonibacter]
MIGGLEDFVRNLVGRQVGRFGSVRVVTLDRLFIEPDRQLPARDLIDGVEVWRIPFRGSPRYPIAPSVLGCLGGADIIHVHAVDFFFDVLAATSLTRRTPMVATTHGGFFHTAKFRRLKSAWFNTVTRATASRYRGIACCSESDLATFRQIAPSRVRLIENAADLDKFGDAAARRPARSLITIGRFSRNKRLDHLLDMMQVLTASDPAWHLHIAGSASDWSEADIRAMIAARDLHSAVTLHVGPSNADIRAVMGACSLFVSASEYEGFGIALIEALSAGLLPVVEPNAAFRSLSRKHDMVRLAGFADPAGAAAAVEAAHSALSERPEALRQAAITSARQHGWETTARLYEDLYRDALG